MMMKREVKIINAQMRKSKQIFTFKHLIINYDRVGIELDYRLFPIVGSCSPITVIDEDYLLQYYVVDFVIKEFNGSPWLFLVLRRSLPAWRFTSL